ncbi:uncharacterized protein EDB93DRAFT_1081262, partial [Suillus bovinus]|uniref:uncharacterized protein n=1 Tax=Suillus bovinus TaxID=48563 RepID=UPI001B877649
SPPTQSRIKHVLLTLRDTLQTSFDSFGLLCLYSRRPSFEPDKFIPSSLLTKTSPTSKRSHESCLSPIILGPPYPFPNMTIYHLMSWMNTGTSLTSQSKVASLIKDVILAEDFDQKHLEKFSIKQSLRCLDKELDGKEDRITFPDNWIETNVTISIPTKSKDDDARPYTIPGFHFCPLVKVIHAAFSDVQARAFHLLPFKHL